MPAGILRAENLHRSTLSRIVTAKHFSGRLTGNTEDGDTIAVVEGLDTGLRSILRVENAEGGAGACSPE